nr:hypothetical protein [Streptococcus mitis]
MSFASNSRYGTRYVDFR